MFSFYSSPLKMGRLVLSLIGNLNTQFPTSVAAAMNAALPAPSRYFFLVVTLTGEVLNSSPHMRGRDPESCILGPHPLPQPDLTVPSVFRHSSPYPPLPRV